MRPTNFWEPKYHNSLIPCPEQLFPPYEVRSATQFRGHVQAIVQRGIKLRPDRGTKDLTEAIRTATWKEDQESRTRYLCTPRKAVKPEEARRDARHAWL